ncbi:c-type cytochrome [Reinekea marina]|uniref:C-type cytochrome n=1 Tax=Reinekea marina TaxID=1310421 RepID=A0ABV7WPM6_9GAMM|nr:c-type cytochrome [Reinekea marina]MDN3647685.1 c-type cytochrome [Reinekea marina]
MKKLLVSFLVIAGLAAGANAAGNAEDGKALTAVCAGCHGADGNSAVATFPKLAGQGEKYLVKQLKDIKEGNRVIVEMTGLLTPYTDQQLEDISAFYAAQSTQVGQADPELVKLGEALYKAGNAKTGVPACAGCHSPKGEGIALGGFPALSGQHADYTIAQLKKFQKGYRFDEPAADNRINDGEAKIMRSIAFNLKDFEIEALASYIQGLH